MQGSESSSSDDDFDVSKARVLVSSANRKKKKSGGFQAMGLSINTYKGVLKKGYKLPTPIQRKVIPLILSGRDVVAMARTGSGKTAAFLIPMFEKFQSHSSCGPRALVLSPTRELAIQTLKFTKELGCYTPLSATIILGGDKMEEQFAALHKNPDVIIATPGRMLHVIMEMNLSLKTIEYVVFDEGDRLFELGFAEQLCETLKRLPRVRQTLIFSATLPQSLIEFVRAGLSDPLLVRLDVDSKLSKNLKLAYISCLSDEKNAILLHLLNRILQNSEQVVVFFATKHHVEFFQMLLIDMGFKTTCIHSGLDPAARNQSLSEFRSGKKRILLVTDVAARGVDIPYLDNVINYHFPTQPKLFLHRVGRVARAGRFGTALSLVDPDELPYLLDVFTFLGKKWQVYDSDINGTDWSSDCIGRAPRSLANTLGSRIEHFISINASLGSMENVCLNAMKRFIQTRPKASTESVRRAKNLRDSHFMLPLHGLFGNITDDDDIQNTEVLKVIRGLKLPTIFEALGKNANPSAFNNMTRKRLLHDKIIEKYANRTRYNEDNKLKELFEKKSSFSDQVGTLTGDGNELQNLEDVELFIPYSRGDENTETGLKVHSVKNQFSLDANAASLDIQGDVPLQSQAINSSKNRQLVWDRKRKRFTNFDAAQGKANMKRIKTESGVWIPASYKTDKYEHWLKTSGSGVNDTAEKSTSNSPSTKLSINNANSFTKFSAKHGGVIEFPDADSDDRNTKHFRRSKVKKNSGDNSDKRKLGRSSQITVIRPERWFERANVNQKQKLQNSSDKQKVRQPKGSRTFGQLRKPEQILKQRRHRQKQLKKQMKNQSKNNHFNFKSKRINTGKKFK